MRLVDDTDPTTRALPQVFSYHLDPTTDLQARGYTLLHQIVLGIAHIDLETSLKISTAEINIQCSKGRTPLAWALRRNQLNDARLLIEYGADITLAGNGGESPLHVACRGTSWGPLDLILSTITSSPLKYSRAVLHQQSRRENTPFHETIWSGKVSQAKLFLSYCNPQEARYALDFGSSKGAGALHIAVQHKRHESLAMLLSFDPNTAGIDGLGLNLLHMAAVCGDVKTIQVLSNAALEGKIKGCSTDLKDSYGVGKFSLITIPCLCIN